MHQKVRWCFRCGVFVAVAAVLVSAVVVAPDAQGAAPGLSDSAVLAHVPARSHRWGAHVARLQTALAQAPADQSLALALARSYLWRARTLGDARALAYAETVLLPWLRADPLSPDVAVTYASALSTRHRFGPALALLDDALDQKPEDAQALYLRASIHTVLGQFDEAESGCDQLGERLGASRRALCLAPVWLMRGRTQQLRSALAPLASNATARDTAALAHSLLADLALWSNDLDAAERHCRAALTHAPEDRYTRILYADLLLETDRPRLVLEQTRASEDDALSLRAALAAVALGHPDAAALIDRARALLGPSDEPALHLREQARLELATAGDARKALRLARASFAIQREAWDVRVLLEAALAAKDRGAARPALAFLRKHGTDLPRLVELARAVERLP